ncbi:MAG: hypothetical protein KJO79_09055, partial [Verrucomicrobiae bacterium]|nr:hypothetical protein [Verrucomicrobiae bacterium]NNJ87317.1 hypothetical protein [Akkermansiaceae bacterium]
MAPGSSYQDALFKRSLNGLVQHHILFGFRGKGSYSLPKSNDGTVSVASQLKPEAQLDAAKIYGFDEDHVSILENRAVIKLVDHIISSGN